MALLEVDGLTRSFGGLVAVNDVSFAADAGEIVGIIGPNGAGKTTLFSLISGFLRPDSGSVRFAGVEVTGEPPHRLARRGLARSFQNVQSFADMSALDAVTAAALLRRSMRAAVTCAEAALERVGLAGKRDLTPASLSLQDKKLLEVAKCIATEPRVILLDEVMAGLTLAEAQVPLALIRDLSRSGIAFVMVEHVMPVIMNVADRIVVVNFGEKLAEGSPKSIVADERVIEAYFGEKLDA